MIEGGWIAVNPRTLETKHPNVYAIGDIANTGAPKAGVFAEGAAKSAASSLIARIAGEGQVHLYSGSGSCYIEFGGERIGRVDVDFFSARNRPAHIMGRAWRFVRRRTRSERPA